MMTYGDLTYMPVGKDGFYLVSHPDLVKDVQITYGRKFTKLFANSPFGNGVLSSEGAFHRRQRRLIQPAFHHSRIEAYGQVIAAYAERLQQGWEDGEVLDIYAELTELSLKAVCRALLGLELDNPQVTAFFDAFADILHLRGETFVSSLGLRANPARAEREETKRKVADAVTAVDRFLYGLIERRRSEGGEGDDVLSMLLQARDEESGGEMMTDHEVRDELMSLVMAGHETTATGLAWTFSSLADNPEVADRLYSEIDEVLGGRLPTVGDIPRLPYMEMVWMETLRKCPPITAGGRRAREDVELHGYIIPAGAPVVIPHYLVHHDPRWHQDPERFDPERWTPERRAGLHRYAYFPFGAGARRCIGESFAELEGRMVLATVARDWRMEPVPQKRDPAHPVSLNTTGYRLRVRRR
jgi:cytochrome P450